MQKPAITPTVPVDCRVARAEPARTFPIVACAAAMPDVVNPAKASPTLVTAIVPPTMAAPITTFFVFFTSQNERQSVKNYNIM